ncbi:MAG: hypothetical protein EZS26_000252 [Candidatus Ordinivivax streblomastigis]|uniref:DUF3823 domain-containing protein n=1 Tax=Candidatus Ordinivivax streblomastigis TaxID=2540710 RepID=A0A5M8P5J9_9BACT|nr:MAG: hypothetical protein EZS26_000252 [Candidatus Ordinivivax streblomastigis]
MKKIISITFAIAVLIGFYSCELDNYDGPDAQISGRILDHHGNLLRTEPGASNMRIQMEELSWAHGDTAIAVTPNYLNVKIDGTYNNSKVFSGTYRLRPIEGAFYPYQEEGDTVIVKGSVVKDFTVTPYLDVDWVVEPHLTADSCIEASFKFIRNGHTDYFMPDVLDAGLFVSSNQYVGNNNYYSDIISGKIGITNLQEGDAIVIKTTRKVKYYNTDVYVRVGANCADAYKKYNYTTIVKIHVP